jgi:hypothetical protein
VKDLVAGTATSLPIFKYTPHFTLVAIALPTVFTTPIVNNPFFLQHSNATNISLVSPD